MEEINVSGEKAGIEGKFLNIAIRDNGQSEVTVTEEAGADGLQ